MSWRVEIFTFVGEFGLAVRRTSTVDDWLLRWKVFAPSVEARPSDANRHMRRHAHAPAPARAKSAFEKRVRNARAKRAHVRAKPIPNPTTPKL